MIVPPAPSIPPAVTPPGGYGVAPPAVTPTVPVAPAVPPPNVEITPTSPPTGAVDGKVPPVEPAGGGRVAAPSVVGQLSSPDAPAFRVAGQVNPGETLRVSYTLSAHDGTGSTSTTGTVTLTSAASVATIPAAAVTAGRRPDVLTLVVHERSGVRPAQPSATLFLTPPQKVGDAALFEAHKLGQSAEAFNVLLRRHGPAVTQAVQRIVVNRTDAQDVSQFVFLELSKFRGRFSGSLTAWLRTVSRNAALAFLRAKRRRLRHEQRAAKAVAAEAPPSASVDEGLIVALGQLPPDQMEAVRLRYLEGYTQQEAAELVGCPRGTLSRRAADGIQALRAILVDDTAARE